LISTDGKDNMANYLLGLILGMILTITILVPTYSKVLNEQRNLTKLWKQWAIDLQKENRELKFILDRIKEG
jgi:hypothetical protein